MAAHNLIPTLHKKIWLQEVLLPFTLTRLALLLAGELAQLFPRNPDFPDAGILAQGWIFSTHRWLDIWGRWDSGWYMSIVQGGYRLNEELLNTQSNIAFWPLFPLVVRGLAALLPASWRTQDVILVIGILFSNVCLLMALTFLRRLVYRLGDGEETARLSVLLLLLFPTSFFLSAFYSESLFLCLSVAAFLGAVKADWRIAGICGGLAAISRPTGILLLIPLGIMAGQQHRWRLGPLSQSAAWLLLIPLAQFVHLASLAHLSHDLFAPYKVQAAWFKELTPPWQTILHPTPVFPPFTHIERIITITFLLLAVTAMFRLSVSALGIYALMSLGVFLLSGTLISAGRYCLILFPCFIFMAIWLARRRSLQYLTATVFFTLQLFLMMAWSQFYFIM